MNSEPLGAAPTYEQLLALLRPAKLTDAIRPLSPWMNPEEAAAYLHIKLGTLRNWTSAKFVPHAKRGRVVRYNRDVIDKWLSRGACPGRTTLADNAK
jgi:excisionase family DNA binding protein